MIPRQRQWLGVAAGLIGIAVIGAWIVGCLEPLSSVCSDLQLRLAAGMVGEPGLR